MGQAHRRFWSAWQSEALIGELARFSVSRVTRVIGACRGETESGLDEQRADWY